MKIAIIGGAGFIGTHLTQAYLNAGHTVITIDKQTYGALRGIDPRTRFYQIDMRDEQLRDILQLERPDLVSYHARQQDGSLIERALTDADVHVRGLLNVLDSCVNASVRKIVFASGSPSMYGNVAIEQLPLVEDTPPCPQSVNDISTIAGEWYVRYYTQHFGLKHTILRYGNIYGEYEPPSPQHPLSYFISMLLSNKRPVIRGTGNEVRDHIFIDDVVRANLNVLQRGDNRTLNISSGLGSSLNQIYTLIAHYIGSSLEPIYLSSHWLDVPAIILDNTRAQHILNWQPEVSLPEGIMRLLARLRTTEELPIARNEATARPDILTREAILTRVS